MNADNIPDSNYIHIERWMYKLGLSLAETAIYACIHGFCQDGISTFSGSVEYLQAWSGSGRSTVFAALKKMVEMKIIVKKYAEYKGKPFPVYYTVRSRKMYQELAERNREEKLLKKAAKKAGYGSSPKSGLESDNKTVTVQKSESGSPESGRNIIALKNSGIAAEEGNAAEALPVTRKISRFLGCNPYPDEFCKRISRSLFDKGFDEQRMTDYIHFVAEKARAKTPESLPAMFRKLVLAEDVIADFIMKKYEDKPKAASVTEPCPCCGHENSVFLGTCSVCDFDMSDKDDVFKVRRAKQIRAMNPSEKEAMESEMSVLFEHFDIRKFRDPAERLRRETAIEAIYRRYGIISKAVEGEKMS